MRLGACADRPLFELDRFGQRLTSGGTIADFVDRRDLQKRSSKLSREVKRYLNI